MILKENAEYPSNYLQALSELGVSQWGILSFMTFNRDARCMLEQYQKNELTPPNVSEFSFFDGEQIISDGSSLGGINRFTTLKIY